jgi:hypothetical protein
MDSELKQYLDSRFETFDKKFETVATKNDLAQQLAVQTETLKAYADEQTEKLAVIINNTVVEPMEDYFAELKDHKSVQEKVATLETDMRKIKSALQLS